jgi:hypothetical protein
MDNQTYILLSEIRDLMRQSVELQKQTLAEVRLQNGDNDRWNSFDPQSIKSDKYSESVDLRFQELLGNFMNSFPQDNNNSDEEID